MNYKQIPKEYFTNLFVLWGLTELLLGLLSWHTTIKWFLDQLWMTSLYLIIFAIIFSIVVFVSLRTIYKNKPLLSRIQQNYRFRIFISIYITILLSIEIAPFFTGITNIMVEENNVAQCVCYPELIFTAQILDFILIPAIYVVFFHEIKNIESVDRIIEKLNQIKIDWKKIILSKGYSNGNIININDNVNRQIYYYKDTSLENETQDQFQHRHYAEVLKNILLHSETPINIGLYGRWGVGKSSILKMLEEKINSKELSEKFKYVYVDAWGLSGEMLKQEVLVELNSKLQAISPAKMEDMLYNVKHELYFDIRGVIKSILPVAVILTGGLIIGFKWYHHALFNVITISTVLSLVATLIQFLISPSKRVIPQAASSHQFNIIYEKMIEKQKKKLVVVIDNLDRCSDKVAVDLLGLIQIFMTKDKCINILACDDEAIVRHLQNIYGRGTQEYGEREGNEFLSKFFQVTIRIPPFIGENLDHYVTQLILQRKEIPLDLYNVKQVLISGAIKNPRKANQFLNNVVAVYNLADLKEKGGQIPNYSITKQTPFLTKIIILRHEWPKFYKLLEKDIQLLDKINNYFNPRVTTSDNVTSSINTEIEKIFAEPQNEGLTEFLSATQYCKTTNILPFLRLNQESYEAGIEGDKFELDVNNNKLENVISTIRNASDDDKIKYIKKLCSINDKHAQTKTIPTLLITMGELINVIDLVQDKELRNFAADDIGKHLTSILRDDISKYDLNKVFLLIKEMSNSFQAPLYAIFIELIIVDKTLNLELVKNILDNNSSLSEDTLNSFTQKLTGLIPDNENAILDLISQVCSTENWNSNKFRKPVKFIEFIINRITFDNSEVDNKRLETYRSISDHISPEDKLVFIDHIRLILDTITPTSQLQPRLLESINNLNLSDLTELDPNTEKLIDSLINVSTIIADNDKKKVIFEILIKILRETN